MAELASLRALLVASSPARGAVAQTPVKSTFALVEAPKGQRMTATREYNRAHKVAGHFCSPCDAGFVGLKTACPRCGAAL
jgi:hypothetical protein